MEFKHTVKVSDSQQLVIQFDNLFSLEESLPKVNNVTDSNWLKVSEEFGRPQVKIDRIGRNFAQQTLLKLAKASTLEDAFKSDDIGFSEKAKFWLRVQSEDELCYEQYADYDVMITGTTVHEVFIREGVGKRSIAELFGKNRNPFGVVAVNCKEPHQIHKLLALAKGAFNKELSVYIDESLFNEILYRAEVLKQQDPLDGLVNMLSGAHSSADAKNGVVYIRGVDRDNVWLTHQGKDDALEQFLTETFWNIRRSPQKSFNKCEYLLPATPLNIKQLLIFFSKGDKRLASLNEEVFETFMKLSERVLKVEE